MKKSIFTSITALLCTMLTTQAAWEITSSGSTFEVSDGDWILQCQKSGSEGNFKISKVIQPGEGKLDLIALNSDIDDGQTDYSLIEITSSLRNKTINGLTIPKTVKSIGDYSFNPNSNPKQYLTGDVVIEEGSELTSIGKQAFQGSLITSVNLNVCTNLKTLGYYSFQGCSLLTTIGSGILPSSITEMQQGIFYGCTSLVGDIYSDATMQMINGEQFRNTKITSLVLPNVYGAIGGYFLDGASAITNVILSQNITSFGQRFAPSCKTIINIEPKEYPKVTSIGANFLPQITNITGDWKFPELTSLGGTDIFRNTRITSFYAPKLTAITGYSFLDNPSLTNVVLSPNLTSISGSSFTGCPNLKSFYPTKLPKLTSLGAAFSGANSLSTPLDFSKSTITSLSKQTFAKCYSMKEIKFPSTLTNIYEYTFEMVKDCDYYFYGLPPKLNQGAFKHNSKERSNVLILPENALTWTNNTVSGYVFTPLNEVPDSEKTDSYQFPKEGRVLGTLKLGPSDIGTHWLSLMPVVGTIILID
ncbi:MAG: leucine-rich repeat domain-containing protein [Kiritimatiellae bacterium]|nr:leucine-rich repeat domain-containing protein [Kiritimatiellia bacterium]